MKWVIGGGPLWVATAGGKVVNVILLRNLLRVLFIGLVLITRAGGAIAGKRRVS